MPKSARTVTALAREPSPAQLLSRCAQVAQRLTTLGTRQNRPAAAFRYQMKSASSRSSAAFGLAPTICLTT